MEQLIEPFKWQGEDGTIILLLLPDSIPKYYRDIVDEYRAVNSSDKLSAWRLLDAQRLDPIT
jgi:hypothetical protein